MTHSYSNDEKQIAQVLLQNEQVEDNQTNAIAVQGDASEVYALQKRIREEEEETERLARLEKMPWFAQTDYGNAERLVYQYGQNIRYCDTWGVWLIWDGSRWTEDRRGHVARMCKAMVRHIQREADQAIEDGDLEMADYLQKHGRKSEAKGQMNAAIDVAKSEPGISIVPEDLDSNPLILNVQNGVLSLFSGQLMSHDRDRLCSKLVPILYDPAATCPVWDGFLNRIMGDDQDLIEWIQRAVGYTLTGLIQEQCFFVLWGTGSNGKSTFINTIKKLLGEYGRTAAITTFLQGQHQKGPRDDLAALHGARFVASQEADEGSFLAESMIKEITGGDEICARHLFGRNFNFLPTFKLWFSTNAMPRITGQNHGIWRRLRYIPFDVTIPDSEQDKTLDAKLQAELSGILRWAVEGCLRWQHVGLNPPAEHVVKATATLRENMDILGDFIAECCIIQQDAHVGSKAIYDRYLAYCESNHSKPVGSRKFKALLEERGYKVERATSGKFKDCNVFQGLEVKPTQENLL